MITNEDVLEAMVGVEISTPISALKVDVPLLSQGLDSLDLATVLLAVECKFDKPISPETAARLRTIVEISAYLNS